MGGGLSPACLSENPSKIPGGRCLVVIDELPPDRSRIRSGNLLPGMTSNGATWLGGFPELLFLKRFRL